VARHGHLRFLVLISQQKMGLGSPITSAMALRIGVTKAGVDCGMDDMRFECLSVAGGEEASLADMLFMSVFMNDPEYDSHFSRHDACSCPGAPEIYVYT
jgi:hypothetical protein